VLTGVRTSRNFTSSGSAGESLRRPFGGTWYRAARCHLINLRDLGARGDGAADDTRAWLAAIAKRGSLYVPAGTYRIHDLGTLSEVQVFGDGRTESLLVQPDRREPRADGQAVVEPAIFWGTIASGVSLCDLALRADARMGQWHQIVTGEGARDIALNHVALSGFAQGYGLCLGHGASQIRISESEFEAGYWGLTIVNVHDVLIASSTIRCRPAADGRFHGGLEIEPDAGQTASDIRVSQCVIDGGGSQCGANLFANDGASIARVRFELCQFRNAQAGIHHLNAQYSIVRCAFVNIPEGRAQVAATPRAVP
jgi:hypothetical protein